MSGFVELLKKWNGGRMENAQKNFAAKTGIAAAMISQYASGVKNPSDDNKRKIAKALRLSLEEVDSVFEQTKAVGQTSKKGIPLPEYRFEVQYIPIYGTSSATREKFILHETEEAFLPVRKGSPNDFAVRVEGDCMADPDDPQNSIYHGDYIVVRPEVDIKNGDIVLARIDGEYSTIKRIYDDKENTIDLVPDNPDCSILRPQRTSVSIVGKVVQVIRSIKSKTRRRD